MSMTSTTPSPEDGFRRRTAATWALIAVSAAGAAGACALAYSTTKVSDDAATVTFEGAPATGFPQSTGTRRATTTTSPPPGINGAPLKSGSGSHTKSYGS